MLTSTLVVLPRVRTGVGGRGEVGGSSVVGGVSEEAEAEETGRGEETEETVDGGRELKGVGREYFALSSIWERIIGCYYKFTRT